VPGHPRCKTDEAIRKMAAKGGVVGITGFASCVARSPPRSSTSSIISTTRRAPDLDEHVGIGSDIDLYGYDAMKPEDNKRLRDTYKGSYGFRERIDIEGLNHPRRMLV